VNGFVDALAAFDDGGGLALYAAGDFTVAGGVPAGHIAKWDGSSWTPLGSAMSDPSDDVHALVVYDDGGGPALYAGGSFTSAGGVPASNISRWDGLGWTSVGSGLDGFVFALAVHDEGGTPVLYAGGRFTSAGGVPASNIAKWDGSSWSALGSGMNNDVYALAVYGDGESSALYAGGKFIIAGGVAAARVARWNGSSWAPLGSGMGGQGSTVEALVVHDDGGGRALFAGGCFPTAGGVAVNHIAKWNGSSWAALGSGMNGTVYALAAHEDGVGPALYVGGYYTLAGNAGDSYLAKWGCPDTTAPVLSYPSSMSVFDRPTNGIGEVVAFTVTATDDLDPSPLVVCSPPSGSLFLPGTTLVTCTATDASGNESTGQFPVVVHEKVRQASFR
jgi:hypothetical protein